MKSIIKRLTAIFTGAALTAGSVPFGMIASAQIQPVGNIKHGMMSSVSDDYIDYINSDEKSDSETVPSMLDMSYLSKSYALLSEAADKKFPSSYDLRDYGMVSPVENQSPYGTCWSFFALGSIESQLIPQFTDISLSKKHLAWNTYENDYMQFIVITKMQLPIMLFCLSVGMMIFQGKISALTITAVRKMTVHGL